jgi:hypothetical protein
MRVSATSMGDDADQVAKIQVGNRALITAEGRFSP